MDKEANTIPVDSLKTNKELEFEEDQEDIQEVIGDEEYWRWIHSIEEENED